MTPGDDPRWDTDTVGHGVASGEPFAGPVEALAEQMRRPDWVTEDPEAHLLPHLQRWCEAPGAPLRLDGWTVTDEGILDVTLQAAGPEPDRSLFALIGTVAEPATHVTLATHPDRLVAEVTLGVLPGAGPFATHGHLLRLSVHTG